MTGTESKPEHFVVTEMGETDVIDEVGCYEKYVQPCVAELLGTGLFVFVGCASVIGNSGTFGAVVPALAHGLSLGILIAAFGQISGGHFNPVVSLSIYLCGGMEVVLIVPYLVCQVLGGLTGASLVKVMYPTYLYDSALGGAFLVNPDQVPQAMITETILSFILTMVVGMCALNGRTRSPMAPFCIGLTVTANILAGTTSGACMNPARALGPAVVASQWQNHWIYWAGPTCGALLTVVFIRLFIGDQKTRIILR